MATSGSHDFIVKTNREVDEWMDSFYTEGRKADFRLHCQWAWQEQERRKQKLIDALSRLIKNDCPLTGDPTYEQLIEHWEYEKTQGRGEAEDQLFALRTLQEAK